MCFLRQKVNITVGNIKYNWLLKIGGFFVKILGGGMGSGTSMRNVKINCVIVCIVYNMYKYVL